MEVKKGYKQTEVGVIPEDWTLTTVRNFAKIITGPFGTLLKASEYSDGNGVPLISVGEIREGYLSITHETPRVSSDVTRRLPQYVLKQGDIVFGRKGGVDRSALIRQKHVGWFLGSDGIALRPFGNLCQEYAALQFQSKRVQSWLLQHAIGTTMPSLNQTILSNVLIPLPPTLAEQEAIAGALSDADVWIESLEQLIAKKRQIKQGAMQELLTGKRRLPGFSGKWEKKRLGEHCRFLRNGTNSRADLNVDGPLKYLHYGDIHSCNNVYMSPKLLPSLPRSKANTLDRLQEGDLVLADASEDTIGISKSVEIVGVDSFELVAGLHTIAVRFSVGIFAPRFVGLLQHCPDFNSHLRKLAAGTKVYATNRRHVSSAEVCVPPLKEQTAIATVLLDMDTEIGSLESKLGKAREIKQGMMQELLTGKIRLIEN
jgi:type I restriction enzyme S subunit